MHNAKDIGAKVVIGREALGITQGQVALRAGVSLSTVKRIEAGGCDSVAFGSVAGVLNAVGFDVHIDRGVVPLEEGDAGDLDLEALIAAKYDAPPAVGRG